jgi:polyhydroxybutyrate depolymerase
VGRWRLALFATVVSVGAACGWGDTAEPTLDEAAPELPAGTSAGCQLDPADPGTERRATGDDDREYLLHTPPAAAAGEALPLVLDFHGFTSDADGQSGYSGVQSAADDLGFVVATPEGTGLLGQWNLPPGDEAAADVAFVLEVVADVAARRCIDQGRIFATGISNGAAFATVLACELDGTIAGVAPVAGVGLVEPCPERAPVPVVAFHGTDDDVVPFDGGDVLFGLAGAEPVLDSVAAWAERNGCDPGSSEERVGTEVRRLWWSGCTEPVELFVVDGGGHTWPGAEEVAGLGHVTDQVDAARLALERFATW